MAYLKGLVTRWIDDSSPGWVEVTLTEANGNVVSLIDKIPVFGLVNVNAHTLFPIPVDLEIKVLDRQTDPQGREVAVIVLSHGVTDQKDRNEFRVLAEQLY